MTKLKNITESVVVHTPTEEEAKELLQILHENGCNTECADYVPIYAKGIEIEYVENNLLWSWWQNIEKAREVGCIILTLAEFKDKYCEEEKTKFKVGDKVKLPFYGGEVSTISEVNIIGGLPYYRVVALPYHVWCDCHLNPYAES